MDSTVAWGHHPLMIVTPLPWRGGVQVDRRDGDRALRVAAHPDSTQPDQGIISLSMWRGDVCIATHQLAASDAADLISLLANAVAVIVDPPGQLAAGAG
jgi:hypothetical protein